MNDPDFKCPSSVGDATRRDFAARRETGHIEFECARRVVATIADRPRNGSHILGDDDCTRGAATRAMHADTRHNDSDSKA